HLLRLGPDRLRDTGLRAEERAGPEVAVPRAPAPPAARRAAARQDGRPDVDGRRPRDAAGPRPRDRRAPRVGPTAADVAEPRAVPPRGRGPEGAARRGDRRGGAGRREGVARRARIPPLGPRRARGRAVGVSPGPTRRLDVG